METTPVKEKYVVVTAISTFRHRYVVPLSELQEENDDAIVDPRWALDAVTMNDVKEFSQEHLGENISDHVVIDEDEMLSLFDSDNEYLSSWSKEQKLNWVKNWKETY